VLSNRNARTFAGLFQPLLLFFTQKLGHELAFESALLEIVDRKADA
jgi:hypothetical protein